MSKTSWRMANKDHCNVYNRCWKLANGGYMKWALANPEKAKACSKSYYDRNNERLRSAAKERAAAWRKNNPDGFRRWRENNRARLSFHQRMREAIKVRAMPRWADKDEIMKKYTEAAAMTVSTGIKHHVDHVWPLRGDGFVGLHVSWNLQVIPAVENIRKGNRRPL